ncbi:MAG: site-specific integrase [Thiomicrorhabdus sp.]|nr:site-specific integrase [Thiomicrorhabdus sp.]
MATITKRKNSDNTLSYMARIRINKDGELVHKESKTFSKESIAKAWAKKREHEIETSLALHGVIRDKMLFSELIVKYIDYLESRDDLKRSKRFTLNLLLKYPIANLLISEMTSKDILSHLRQRLLVDGAKPQTVNNDLSYIGSSLRYASSHLELHVNLNELAIAQQSARDNKFVSRPDKRDRRPSEDEVERIISHFERKGMVYMIACTKFAIVSARRQSEITRILWSDLNKNNSTILVRDLKHPTLKNVNKVAKLTNKAMAIIEGYGDKGSPRIFPYNSKTVSVTFTNACRMLGIENLRFHDLRHEATSSLFEEGYSIVEVQQFTLHESWNVLARYTHLKPENVELRD